VVKVFGALPEGPPLVSPAAGLAIFARQVDSSPVLTVAALAAADPAVYALRAGSNLAQVAPCPAACVLLADWIPDWIASARIVSAPAVFARQADPIPVSYA